MPEKYFTPESAPDVHDASVVSVTLGGAQSGLYSVSLADSPNQLRFLEIYADDAAYRQHIRSPHFLKYVEATKPMIVSRKLLEVTPIFLGLKQG